MNKDEALKLALEAHRNNESHRTVAETRYWCEQYKLLAQQAIEALAQPEQDEKFCDSNCVWTDHHPDCKLAQPEPVIDKSAAVRIATSLGWEPKRTWQRLTDEEIALICGECAASAHKTDDISYARAIEAKLKEKNT